MTKHMVVICALAAALSTRACAVTAIQENPYAGWGTHTTEGSQSRNGETTQPLRVKRHSRSTAIFAPTEETITVEFREVPLDVALRRLVREKNYAFIYSRSRPPPDAGARSQRLKEVHVYPGPAEAIARPEPIVAPDASRATIGAVEGLARVLLEAPPRVLRKRAAGALGTMRDQLATDALRRALAQDDDASVRETAARSLGKTWNEDAVAPLASAVVDDPDAFVREAAAAGLGETWSEAAVEPLARALATDPRAAVRAAAAVGLGRTWSEVAIEPLTRAAATDPSARVRESAAKALHSIDAERP